MTIFNNEIAADVYIIVYARIETVESLNSILKYLLDKPPINVPSFFSLFLNFFSIFVRIHLPLFVFQCMWNSGAIKIIEYKINVL